MKIAIVGAGPAGLTSARQALARGHSVTLFERHAKLGGIWNPDSGGAYPGVRMQSSRMSFPFSDFEARAVSAFPTLDEVHAYLNDYADAFSLRPHLRCATTVTRISRHDQRWRVRAHASGSDTEEAFDAVLLATGELWQPRVPLLAQPAPCRLLTPQSYRGPAALLGQRVLVVGGGVSGADIAAELGAAGVKVAWSVRRRALFLPRQFAGVANDALFSYAGRIAIDELSYPDYLARLEQMAPSAMRRYRQSGLLPEDGFTHAVHVNDHIIERVVDGSVQVRPAFAGFRDDAAGVADGTRERFDTVILCLGYAMPDYRLVEGFAHAELYQHFLWRRQPTLAVINTPADTEAFGTACPYFEAVAGWVLATLDGQLALPSAAAMQDWCAQHMQRLHEKRHYDCWLETIALRLQSGSLPDPCTDFARYWTIVSSQVAPANLLAGSARQLPASYDDAAEMAAIKARILAGLPCAARDALLLARQIDNADHRAAALVAPERVLAPHLPYRMLRQAAPRSRRLS